MPRCRWSAGWLLAAACGLAGCAGDGRRAGSTMPGPPPPPDSTAVATLPTPGPGTNPSTSPAALAQNPSPSLDLRADLRGGTPARQPYSPPPPRPIFATPTRSSAAPRTLLPTGGTHVASYEQAMAFLASRGVKWRRLETWGDSGEVKFSCSIPSPQNAYISRTYEARADTDLAAIRAVLEQIEKER